MDDRLALVRHLREAHANLLTESGTPLPRSGLSAVPTELLLAIHEANHAPLYRAHGGDDWLARRAEAAADA